MYISVIYGLTYSLVKNNHFLLAMQKIKKTCLKKAYFSTEHYYFYIDYIKIVFYQNYFVDTYNIEMCIQYFSFNF
jgi:hypothetical protein